MAAGAGTVEKKDGQAAEEAIKEQTARSLCMATCLLMAAVTMVVPTRAPMVLAIKKGDAAATAKAMGLMSTCAAVIELVVNPILGKLSDQFGRKPFLMMTPIVSAVLHIFVAALPRSLPTQFIDRMIGGSMIFGFAAPAQAAMADLFAKEPTKLAMWGAKNGMFLGIGTTLGPMIGSKLGGAMSFLASSLVFCATSLWVKMQVSETLSASSRKPFRFADINPVAFLKLFKNKTLTLLAGATALQSFGDYVNIYDINNLFMIKTLGYGPSQIGNFATMVGVTQIAGGRVTAGVIEQLKKMKVPALKVAALFANVMWAIGMATMGTAKGTPQAFFALFLWTFGHQRSNSISVYLQKYGAAEGMGRAEIVAATGNLLAYVKVLIPLFYSSLYAWATSNGRNMPGLPYFVISALTALAQGSFWLAAPQD
mmetsp:Transcript_107256/g.313627  ORF Transcript_107256/g.313627 Transcript_107256/m.313627 type:complete len:425 (+) Transcript_107256:59-1333(+)